MLILKCTGTRILEPSLAAVGWEASPGEGNRAQTRAALIDRLGGTNLRVISNLKKIKKILCTGGVYYVLYRALLISKLF
jgi:hypothetical protein